jgi:hypothetical protein
VEIPAGVDVVAILTLLSIFPLGMLFLLTLAVSAVGMGSGLPLTWYNLWAYLPLLFGLFALISSILLLKGVRSRFLWGSLIAYWMVLFVYFVPFAVRIWSEYSTGENAGFRYLATYQIESLIVVILPHVYAAACSAYFLVSKRVLRYFGLMKVSLASK